MSLLSVVIPIYNAEKVIEVSVNSVLKQTYNEIEIILVNDGSTDETANYCEAFQAKYQNVHYYHKDNGGVSSARNYGIKVAKGDFICFLDCDDTYDEYFAEYMMNEIKTSKSQLTYCGFNAVSSGEKAKFHTKFKNQNLLENYLLGITSIQTAGWLIDLDFLRNEGITFKEEVSWGEDVEFFSQMINKAKTKSYVDKYLVNYNIGHSDDQLSSFNIGQIDRDYESNKRLMEYFKDDKFVVGLIKEFRLQSSIVFKLVAALQNEVPHETVLSYYDKYLDFFNKNYWVYGLKSLKLNLMKLKLKFEITKIR